MSLSNILFSVSNIIIGGLITLTVPRIIERIQRKRKTENQAPDLVPRIAFNVDPPCIDNRPHILSFEGDNLLGYRSEKECWLGMTCRRSVEYEVDDIPYYTTCDQTSINLSILEQTKRVPVGDILLSYKPNLFISEFPTSTWLKIGKVVNLFMYPLLMGKECPVDKCELTFDDMYMYRKDQLVTWDRSFMVYNIETKCVVTANDFLKLRKVKLLIEDNYIMLEADNMSTLRIKLESKKFVQCIYVRTEEFEAKVDCTDCGDDVAQWLSKYLSCKGDYLRLGYTMWPLASTMTCWQPDFENGPLFIEATGDNKGGPFISVLWDKATLKKLKNKIPMKMKIYNSEAMICPNIIISVSDLYSDKTKWIKIGDVIIKIVKPLDVMSSFRKSDKCLNILGFGVNCKLCVPGHIKFDDNVYVHF